MTGKWAKSKGFTNVQIVTDPLEYKSFSDINKLERLDVIITK